VFAFKSEGLFSFLLNKYLCKKHSFNKLINKQERVVERNRHSRERSQQIIKNAINYKKWTIVTIQSLVNASVNHSNILCTMSCSCVEPLLLMRDLVLKPEIKISSKSRMYQNLIRTWAWRTLRTILFFL